MIRFYRMVLLTAPHLLRCLPHVRRLIRTVGTDAYSEEENYRLACDVVDDMRIKSRTKTRVFGLENLPAEGGYLLYANHQGKYDALGIMLSHPRPLAVLMEMKQSMKFPARQIIDLMCSQRIDLTNPRQQLRTLNAITEEVMAGRRYLIFPEGGYDNNGNDIQPFKDGCFLCAVKSKAPVVPVVIVDSHLALNTDTFEPVVTEVHFLPPFLPKEGQSRQELCAETESRIRSAMADILAKRASNDPPTV